MDEQYPFPFTRFDLLDPALPAADVDVEVNVAHAGLDRYGISYFKHRFPSLF
jgi:hypothetical protein